MYCAEHQPPQLATVHGVFPELAAGVGAVRVAVAHAPRLPVLPVLLAVGRRHSRQPQHPEIGL